MVILPPIWLEGVSFQQHPRPSSRLLGMGGLRGQLQSQVLPAAKQGRPNLVSPCGEWGGRGLVGKGGVCVCGGGSSFDRF